MQHALSTVSVHRTSTSVGIIRDTRNRAATIAAFSRGLYREGFRWESTRRAGNICQRTWFNAATGEVAHIVWDEPRA